MENKFSDGKKIKILTNKDKKPMWQYYIKANMFKKENFNSKNFHN